MSFFYNINGDNVKIYIDLVLILNFLFDVILLMSVSYILKRNIKSYSLVVGGLIGSLSTLLLFYNINSVELFSFKVILSILMVVMTFGFRNIRYTFKNLTYFYFVSIVLGGFLYFLNITFSYRNDGLVFYNNGLSVNFIFLLIISPIILFLYSRQVKELKNNYSNYYRVNLILNNYTLKLSAYFDTGNKLVDPYFKRPVFILNKKKMIYDINEFKMVLVPYKTISNSGILKCIIADKLIIEGVGCYNEVLIGLSEEEIKIDGVDMILNSRIQEKL